MAENLILPFAQGQGANVLSQTDYAGDSMRLQGHQPGVARSALENKALLQCSSIAAGLAQFIADGQAADVTDAKTPAEIAEMLAEASAANVVRAFTTSASPTNGYQIQEFDGGITLQWQVVNTNVTSPTTSSETTFTFPVAFDTSVNYALVTPRNNFYDGTVTNTLGVVASFIPVSRTQGKIQFFGNNGAQFQGNYYFSVLTIGR